MTCLCWSTHTLTHTRTHTCRNDEYIAPGKAKAIQRLLVELCSELRCVVYARDVYACHVINATHVTKDPISFSKDMGFEHVMKTGLKKL